MCHRKNEVIRDGPHQLTDKFKANASGRANDCVGGHALDSCRSVMSVERCCSLDARYAVILNTCERYQRMPQSRSLVKNQIQKPCACVSPRQATHLAQRAKTSTVKLKLEVYPSTSAPNVEAILSLTDTWSVFRRCEWARRWMWGTLRGIIAARPCATRRWGVGVV